MQARPPAAIQSSGRCRHSPLNATWRAGTAAGGKTVLRKDLKSLSGGERSFTCVSFILSLGTEVNTPFFAMDEFDVFMDAVNRRVALSSILRFAWEMRDVQFILLSPLDTQVIEQSRAEVNEVRAAPR